MLLKNAIKNRFFDFLVPLIFRDVTRFCVYEKLSIDGILSSIHWNKIFLICYKATATIILHSLHEMESEN